LQQPSPKAKMICRANRFQQKSAPYSKRSFRASCPPSLTRGENNHESAKGITTGFQATMQSRPIPTTSAPQSKEPSG
jgi:hypothetical protein